MKDRPAERFSRRLIWLSGLTTISLAGGIAWYLAPLEPGILALQFAYTPRAFGEIIHFWSAEQLQRFRMHLPTDSALLLCYGLFGYLLGTKTRLFGAWGRVGRGWAIWALPLAAAFDGTENILHWWLTEMPRFGAPLQHLSAAVCATVKWGLLLAWGATVIVGLACSEEADRAAPPAR